MEDDTDDMKSNALIAQLLAADYDQQGYGASYDDYGDGEASDDLDYGEKPKKRQKKGNGKAGGGGAVGRPPKTKPPAAAEGAEGEEFTATGRRKRRDTGAKRDVAASRWTEEEERLFLEGLELYGREWKLTAQHIGTRDTKQLTSHAQKHFIKLCIADKPLPQKVVDTGKEGCSGLGYTLSGALLDPYSASSVAYGLKPEHVERLLASGGPGAKGLLLQEKENAAETASRAQNGDAAQAPTTTGNAPGVGSVPLAEAKPVKKPPAEKTARGKKEEQAGVSGAVETPSEPTEYAKNRPRREGAGTKSKWGQTGESLELVRCREFMGPPGSGAAQSQPFEVTIDGQVNLVMDFHAHLCGCEIIGLLGGTWDPKERLMEVKGAYPCQRVAGSHSGTSVEVDPQAQVLAQEQMERQGWTSIGWYHSHPIFAPMPSQKDNENQRNQQALHRCTVSGLEPCIGVIVGPYDQSLPSEASIISHFVVQSRGSELVPFHVRLKAPPQPPPLPDAELESTLKRLINSCADDPDRTKLMEPADSMRLTYLRKMWLAMSHHLRGPNSEAAPAFLDSVFSHLKKAWGVTPPPAPIPEPRT